MLSPKSRLRTVLLDNGIFSHSEFAECAVSKKHFLWNGKEQTVFVHGVRRKSSKSNSPLQAQINALPTVGRLIRDGIIEAYEYPEIWCERMRYRMPLPFGNALRGCKVVTCSAPLERTKFVSTMDFAEYLAKGGRKDRRSGRAVGPATQLSFLKLLCALDCKSVDVLVKNAKRLGLTDPEIESLRDLPWFQLMCETSGNPENYPDIFHLWTAERNRLHVFLTLDNRFADFVSRAKNQKKIEIRTEVLQPLELLVRLGIKHPDPVALGGGRFYHLHELD